MKVKVESVNVGNFEYDSIIVTLNDEKTEIVFNKKDNVLKYEGKMVELEKNNGTYTVKEVDSIKK